MTAPHLSSPQLTWGWNVRKPRLPSAPTSEPLLLLPSRLTGTEPHAPCAGGTRRPGLAIKSKVTKRPRVGNGPDLTLGFPSARGPGSQEPRALLPPSGTERGLTAGRSRPTLARLGLPGGRSARSRTARGCCLGFTGDGHRLLPVPGGAPANQRAPLSAREEQVARTPAPPPRSGSASCGLAP